MKNVLIGFILSMLAIHCKSQNNMKIMYVYDALCGWCYGFAPVMSQFQDKYKDRVGFEVISGGMITGNRIGAIGEVAPYISWAYKDVEKATNVKFGSDFLDKTLKAGTAIFTSVPAAIALSVFKKIQPENSLAFASALQKAIYFDGIEPENYDSYGAIATEFGLGAADFVSQMKDPRNSQEAVNDFRKSSDLGVTGFPTVFVEANGVYHKIASGYVPFHVLENNFLTVQKSVNE